MMLQAAALGLGTCWIGGLDRKAIGDVLKLPEGLEMVGLLTLGFPDETPDPPQRKPLAQIVHYDIYGNQIAGRSHRRAHHHRAAGRCCCGSCGSRCGFDRTSVSLESTSLCLNA